MSRSKIQTFLILSLQVGLLFFIGINIISCKSQKWEEPNKVSETRNKKKDNELNRLVYRSTLKWGVKVYENEQEFLELYKPRFLTFSQKAKFTIQLFQDTIKEVKVLNGQDMPVFQTISPVNSDTISFNLEEYFCSEKYGKEFDRLYIIIYTKVGHRQSLSIDLKNNDKQLICD